MTDAIEWQGRVGDSWASNWRRTDRSFDALTDRLLARTREFSFDSALDVGCGAGELSLALARTQPQGTVLGVDISPALIEVARERAAHLANVTFEVADAATWQSATRPPGFLISRHGVMFFDNPLAAFTNLRVAARPAAGLMFSCFRMWDENPVFADIVRMLPNSPPPPESGVPGPFAFADRQRVAAILEAAGWHGIAFEPFDFAMFVGAGDDPVEDTVAYFSVIGPAARAAGQLTAEEKSRFDDQVRELAQANLDSGLVSLRAAAWIVTARND
ncbi:MAG: class I SAM-dependent methyltransferase [Croceibacterium sp.]